MRIVARVTNAPGRHDAEVATEGATRALAIPPKAAGAGSAVNGGELLFLALATCYCNDVYREAARRGIEVERVEVEVEGEFGGPGEPARAVTYRAAVKARAGDDEVRALMAHVDGVAEIQNTLRAGVGVTLREATVLR